MFKLIVFATLLACAAAAPGIYGGYAPISPWGGLSHGYVGAPIIKTAVPVATSYANTVRIASPALAVAHAPVVAAHGPFVAPAYGHAPFVAPAYAHAW